MTGKPTSIPLFELSSMGIKATGHPQGKGFIVRAGSTARAEITEAFKDNNYSKLRTTLLDQGRLVKTTGSDLFMYKEDVLFDSVSAAAAVTLGRASNGRTAWKMVGSNRTFADWKDGPVAGPMFSGATAHFDWVPFFKALGQKLLDFEGPERQLVLLRLLRDANVSISPDENEELSSIDPFTFFSLVLKHRKPERVQELFSFIGQKLEIQETIPAEFHGVPGITGMNAWFFAYRSVRKPEDIPTLWKLAKQAVDGTLQPDTFEQALKILQVGLPKLTQGLFWLNPEVFLPLNNIVVHYLREMGVGGVESVKTLQDYHQVLEQSRNVQKNFPLLSHGAWLEAQKTGRVIQAPDVEPQETVFLAPPGIPLNQILYGPPGTGKTYTVIDEALRIVDPAFAAANEGPEKRRDRKQRFDELLREGQITFVTFHQSFGYEDFIEGLKPEMEDGKLAYRLEDGLFLKAVQKAGGRVGDQSAENTLQAHVLIIDEINRGNISKIFGELITLLEDSKRAGAAEGLVVNLPLSKRQLSVPQSLYVMGTMNTADRSLTQLDAALRRRFTFKAVWPDPTLLPEDQKLDDVSEGTLNLRQFLQVLNERIEERLSRDQMIGHAYLLNVPPTLEQVSAAFRTRILPLLEEYFFEDWTSIREVLGDDQKKDLQDQFIHVTDKGKGRRFTYNEAAFSRLSAFQGLYEVQ